MAWIILTDIWDTPGKVKHPKRNALEVAITRAKLRTTDRPELAGLRDKRMILLGHVCYELQQLNSEDKFFLTNEDAGKAIGLCEKLGGAGMKHLQRQGIIELLQKGHTGFASVYRYIATGHSIPNSQISDQVRKYKETGNL